jgi:hypothetical protein
VLNKATECYGKIDLATELSVLRTLQSTLHISIFFLMLSLSVQIGLKLLVPTRPQFDPTAVQLSYKFIATH